MHNARTSQFVIEEGMLHRATTEEHIKWCVRAILNMQKGESPFLPQLGADLLPLMFRRDCPILRSEIRERIENSLKIWEPRIDVEETEISPDSVAPEFLAVQIRYRIKESRRLETLKVNL